ncbi:VOC family protein [Peribacillus sp. SCS-155]
MHGIAHFEIQVADTQRTIEFYKNVFGWKIEKLCEGKHGNNKPNHKIN